MGRDRLIEKIKGDGKEQVAAVNAQTQQRVAEISERLAREVSQLEAQYRERIQRETRLITERARSRARLEERKTLLAAKWEVIDQALSQAGERFVKDPEYASLVKAIVEKHGRGAGSVVRLSERDRAGLGKGLKVKLGEAAPIKGGAVIEVQREVLSFALDDALAALRDRLARELAQMLFPEPAPEKKPDA